MKLIICIVLLCHQETVVVMETSCDTFSPKCFAHALGRRGTLYETSCFVGPLIFFCPFTAWHYQFISIIHIHSFENSIPLLKTNLFALAFSTVFLRCFICINCGSTPLFGIPLHSTLRQNLLFGNVLYKKNDLEQLQQYKNSSLNFY